jgi:hypothetical protein
LIYSVPFGISLRFGRSRLWSPSRLGRAHSRLTFAGRAACRFRGQEPPTASFTTSRQWQVALEHSDARCAASAKWTRLSGCLDDARWKVPFPATQCRPIKQPTRAVTCCRIWEAQPKGALQWLAGLDDALVAGIILPICAKKTAEGRRASYDRACRVSSGDGAWAVGAGRLRHSWTRQPAQSQAQVEVHWPKQQLHSGSVGRAPACASGSLNSAQCETPSVHTKLDFSTTPNRPAPSRFGETRLQIST